MKAEIEQIPVKEVKSTSQNHGPRRGPDNYWAMLRRINARLTELERAVSTIRRDVSRIDRKQYRDAPNPPSEQSQEDDPFNALFTEAMRQQGEA